MTGRIDGITEAELLALLGNTPGKARVLKAARIAEDRAWGILQEEINGLRMALEEAKELAAIPAASPSIPQDVREAAEALIEQHDLFGSPLDIEPLREAVSPRRRIKCPACGGVGKMGHGGQWRVWFGATTVREPDPEVMDALSPDGD